MLDGHIVSSKGDNHGYGQHNVENIVDKYGGRMVVKHEGGGFDVYIIMYI